MSQIRFGVWIDAGMPSQTLSDRLREVAPLLELAERSGFTSVWVGEAWPPAQREWHEQTASLLFLAALSGMTEMRLGTGVLLLPATTPLRLAYEAAVLDQLSGGRLTLGVGSGPPALASRFGIPREGMSARLDETVEALKALWTGADGFEGRVVRVEGPIAPPPVQAGGPPVWVGGQVERAVSRAARLGDGWYAATTYPVRIIERLAARYRELCAETGRRAGPIAVNRFIHVGATTEVARREAAPYRAALDAHYGPRIQPGDAENIYLLGDAEEVDRELERYAAAGVTDIAVRVTPAGLPPRMAAESIRRLADSVLPRWT